MDVNVIEGMTVQFLSVQEPGLLSESSRRKV